MRTLLLVAGMFALTACATPQERAQKVVERYGPYCEGLGYKKDTDPWRQCIQTELARVTAFIMSDDPAPSKSVRTTCTSAGDTFNCKSR